MLLKSRMDMLYFQKWLYKAAMVILIVGALNWFAVGAFGFNAVEKVFGYKSIMSRFVYVIVGVAALAIMFNRDTYLPFLGETVMPCHAIPEHIPDNADTQLEVHVSPGAKVVYWAAEPNNDQVKDLRDWRGAYQKYENMGCVKANEDGVAVLLVRKPQPYRVPWKGRLEPHVHFRECSGTGMMGRIKTVFVSDGRVEGFVNMDEME
jgi:uncharacterized membrane protein YuzA (DUF378 family)